MARAVYTKERVERAAVELFATKGVDGSSIGEIAALAQVSQGALYRHYPSKQDLARSLFSTAYRRIGGELAELRRREPGFAAQITAMVVQFCALYDADAALFRFLLLTQHNFLPRLADEPSAPPTVIADAVADAIDTGELAPVEPALGAAVVMGVVLQAATFHLYGRITGPLSERAPALAHAALAAVKTLGKG
jgi:AcrR family transcriptional regulator